MNIIAVLDDKKFADNYIDIAKRIKNNVSIIWYRIKETDTINIYKRAMALRLALPDTYLALSEKADIASILNYNAVHLNANSLPAEIVKKKFANLDTAYSAHNLSEITTINADYFTLSPIFKTDKPFTYKPIGIVKPPANKKVYALGGVALNDYNRLIDKGYFGIAGISFITSI